MFRHSRRFIAGRSIDGDQSKGVEILEKLLLRCCSLGAVEETGKVPSNLDFGDTTGSKNRITRHEVDGRFGVMFADIALQERAAVDIENHSLLSPIVAQNFGDRGPTLEEQRFSKARSARWVNPASIDSSGKLTLACDRHKFGDWFATISNGHPAALSHSSDVLGQFCLEFSNANVHVVTLGRPCNHITCNQKKLGAGSYGFCIDTASGPSGLTTLESSDQRRRIALAIAATAMLLAAFVGTATNIAIPVLEEEFPDVGLTHISWVISAFAVTQVTFMLLGGRLADRIGRRRIFVIGLGVFAVGAALSALAPTIDLVIAARVLQALGVALIIPSSLAAVLPLYPKEQHGSVVSLWSSMGVLGAAAAPTVAAGLLEASSWRVVFAIVVPIAIGIAVLASRYMADDTATERPPPLDLLGTITGTMAVGGATFVIVQGRAWGWSDDRIVVAFITTVIGGVIFIRSSRRHDEPLLDFELLKIPSLRVVATASAFLSMSTAATWFLYPLFLSDVWQYSNLEIGLAMTPGPLTLVLCAPLAGRMVDRHGYRELLIFGGTLATIGTAWMAWRLRADETYVRAFLPGTISIGLGMAFMLGPANAAALRDVPLSQLGAANAAFNTARSAFSAFGIAITTAIIGKAVVGERIEEFRLGWWSMVAVMSLSPVLLWFFYPPADTTAS